MKKILSFGAHPDDIEIGCGGTEAKLIKVGWKAAHVLITSGELGSMKIVPEELISIRESEAIRAAKILGVEEVYFLKAQDGLTGFSRDLKIKIIEMIRKIKPNIVFLHSKSELFFRPQNC